MVDSRHGNDDEMLDALLRAYREACPTPEASANFMPNLWQRIESRQRFTFSFQRMATGFVATAVALSLALGVYMAVPRTPATVPMSYIEVLAESHPVETPDFVTPVQLDLSEQGR